MRPGLRRLTAGAVSLIAPAVMAMAAVPAEAALKPSFSLGPEQTLDPGFGFGKSDFAARCADLPLSLEIDGAKGWESRVGNGRYSSGNFDVQDAGTSAVVSFRKRSSRKGKGAKVSRFHVRCLPSDFPAYEFDRTRAGGPKLFTMQLVNRYAAIFNRDGIPVWWYRASGQPDNVEVLRNGTVAFAPVDAIQAQSADYEIHDLEGRLLRTVTGGGGEIADIHELLLLPNGNFMLGTSTQRSGVDTSAYGGSADGTVLGIDIQEITPKGKVVWSWSSEDHIGLEETGRWWPLINATQPYDIVHWNSVEVEGNRVLLSFRHLDAVYAINRKTGEVVWKLGGTETPESLRIKGDPEGEYPFGGQHDARYEPDGTVTIFDNDTGLDDAPRTVRYEIDQKAGTAKLVEEITDPDVPVSLCCGSARKLPSNDWLISWGGTPEGGVVGAYDHRGRELFELRARDGFPYRALPVEEAYVTIRELRQGMNARKG